MRVDARAAGMADGELVLRVAGLIARLAAADQRALERGLDGPDGEAEFSELLAGVYRLPGGVREALRENLRGPRLVQEVG